MEGPSKKKKKIEKQCSFGCHHGQQCSESEYQSFLDLADDEQTVYRWRAGINPDINITSICEFHKNYFGDSEFKRKSKCCDPNKVHKKVKKPDGSHTITLEWAMQLKLKSIDVVPGWKLCRNCHKHIKELLENDTDSVDDEFLPEAQECALDSTLNTSEKREELNEYWQMMGISPLKTHAVPTASKIKDASEKITRSQEKQKELAKELFNLPSTSLLEKREKIEISTDIQRKAEQFDRLMFLFKEKLSDKATTSSQKLQILTMAPLDWSRQQVAKFFEVSEYLVREARKLAAEKGILALPDAKKGRSLSKEVEDSVRLFFEDDEYSRQMPGTKDFVSVSRNVHKQKRLLLCNLKELHQAYKAKFPDHNISLSKFCQLRPKWCVTIAASGSHSVCVCKIHQNAKLMVDTFSGTVNTAIRKREREYLQEIAEREENGDSPLAEKSFPLCNVTYKDLMKIAVCDLDNMQCMVHRCDSCPTYTALQLYIERLFEEYDICDDITYSQWDSTDRTTLHTSTASVEEFIENLVYSIDSLTTHSFIARSQSQFLKSRKEAIDNTTAIVLVDFAENYHYIVQDEIQGYHWNKDQCTIHPVVIYYKDNDKLAYMSHSIILDDLKHDTTFIHEIQRLVCQHISATLPDINSIEYWSDGCAGQYKNFMNLCHHEEDFLLKATWSFFATSHGKFPCNGIEETVKGFIADAIILFYNPGGRAEKVLVSAMEFYCAR